MTAQAPAVRRCTKCRRKLICGPNERPARFAIRRFCRKCRRENHADPAAAARLLWIESIEDSYQRGNLGRVLGRNSPSEKVRKYARAVYNALLTAMFPREFGDRVSPETCPSPGGPRRCGEERMRAMIEEKMAEFAALIVGAKGAGKGEGGAT